MLHEAVRLRAGDDDRAEGDRRERRRDVEVRGRRRAAVHQLLDERVLAGVQHGVIEQAEDVEDRDQADRVRAEDEEEERQDAAASRC